jgi:hypothetical protein
MYRGVEDCKGIDRGFCRDLNEGLIAKVNYQKATRSAIEGK